MHAPPRPYPSRRSPGPGAEPGPGPPPGVPLLMRATSPAAVGLQPRSSVASSVISTRSAPSGSKRAQNNPSNSSVPLSQIEKSVTHLLVATKQLLETLTQWSRGQASDTQVSDVYVKLGYEFNMACRAFSAINVDTSDLGNVPDLLRHILEATLSQEASVESLEKYLPRIRDIIINLLHGLKRKQQKLRQKQSRDRENGLGAPAAPERTTSVSTVATNNTGLTNLLDEDIENSYRAEAQRGDSLPANFGTLPARRFPAVREPSRGSVASEHSSLSSTTMQNIPVLPPYPEENVAPASSPINDFNIDEFPPPPPPPPEIKGQSALAALQKGGDLERRASRRYSQYQISKHLGGATNGVPILPPQNTPVPNRGREFKESIRAVQVRESVRHNRNSSSNLRAAGPPSPVRIPRRVSEEPSGGETPTGSPAIVAASEPQEPKLSATINGPPPPDPFLLVEEPPEPPEPPVSRPRSADPEPVQAPEAQAKQAERKSDDPFIQQPPTPPSPAKELTLFLQYKSKVKKLVLPDGYNELSIGRLQLAFIDKFSWNTHNNGVDLPEIYIQDPVSGVRHELEDLADIKDRTVLVLNVEALDEVKRHIDDGIGSLAKLVKELKQNVDDQGAALQRVSERQQEVATNRAAALASAPPVVGKAPESTTSKPSTPTSTLTPTPGRRTDPSQLNELRTLRRDLAIMRQMYSDFESGIQQSMSALRTKASKDKAAAVARASASDTEGDGGAAYVSRGRKQLNTDSDRLVNKVDDLQDTVEDLRKDVVHRGVRPLPRQLEVATKDIAQLTKELKKMDEYIKQERPVWTGIWEKELEDVCQGRDELRLMEDLLVDLQDDLEKASGTFALVEAATKEQMKDNGTGASAGVARNFSRGLNNLGNSLDQNAAKEGVLGEVRALQPNHQIRLEAIERAEKLRQKELESRKDGVLQKEIKSFVEEGKLKKSGGFEEVERARKVRDERIRREVWERQNGIVPEDPVGEGTGEDGPANSPPSPNLYPTSYLNPDQNPNQSPTRSPNRSPTRSPTRSPNRSPNPTPGDAGPNGEQVQGVNGMS